MDYSLRGPKESDTTEWLITARAVAEAAVLWLPDTKSWLIGKDPDAGKDWRQEEKGETEDETVDDITDSMEMSLSKLWEIVKDREAQSAAVHVVSKSQTKLSDWTITTIDKATAEFEKIDSNSERSSTVGKMLRNSSACYREIIYERKSQLMWQTLLLSYLKELSQPSQS